MNVTISDVGSIGNEMKPACNTPAATPNPYETPQSRVAITPNRNGSLTAIHRNFRLTSQGSDENPHFVIGKVWPAIGFALLQQTVWNLFVIFLPTGKQILANQLQNQALIATLLFWMLFAPFCLWMKGRLAEQQILALKWGYMPMFLIVANIQNLVQLVLILG